MTTRLLNTRSAREQRIDAELEAEIKANAGKVDENGNPVAGGVPPEDEDLSKEDKSWKKRHDDMKSYMQKQINDLNKQLGSVQTQLQDAAKKQIKFPKTEEEVTEWITKYPDVAAIVKTIAMKEVSTVREELEAQKTVLAEQEYQVEFNKNLNRIVKAHDDFFDLQRDEKFTDWVQTQPKHVRLAFGDDVTFEDLEDAADTIIGAVKLYKLENKKPAKQPNDDRREAARAVVTRNGSSTPGGDRDPNLIYESEIMALTTRQYTDQVDAEVNKAMREGRFVYDVTGAAR